MIQDQEDASWHQDRKSRQPHARSNEPRPGAKRQAPETHAPGSHIERGGNEVQGAQQLADAENPNGSSPENYDRFLAPGRQPHPPRSAARTAVHPPSGGPSPTKNAETKTRKADKCHPERHHVEVGEGHVFSAHLNRQEDNCRRQQMAPWSKQRRP